MKNLLIGVFVVFSQLMFAPGSPSRGGAAALAAALVLPPVAVPQVVQAGSPARRAEPTTPGAPLKRREAAPAFNFTDDAVARRLPFE